MGFVGGLDSLGVVEGRIVHPVHPVHPVHSVHHWFPWNWHRAAGL